MHADSAAADTMELASAQEDTSQVEIATYQRPGHASLRGWATLAGIAAAAHGSVTALALRKRVQRLKDDAAVIWRPTSEELQELHAVGAFAKLVQVGILVDREFAPKLCPELLMAAPICGQKRAHGTESEDDLDDESGHNDDDDADTTPATKRPTVGALTMPGASDLQLAPSSERLSIGGGDDDDDDVGGDDDDDDDDLSSIFGASAATGGGVTGTAVSFTPPDEEPQHGDHAPSAFHLAQLAMAAGGGAFPATAHEEASSHVDAPPGLVRRRGKRVDVPADASKEQRMMLTVLAAFASTRVAKNKAHQFLKVASQFVLGATSVKRSGSFMSVCRNSDLLGSKLFVESLRPSAAVTGLKASVAPAELSVWRRVGAELGV